MGPVELVGPYLPAALAPGRIRSWRIIRHGAIELSDEVSRPVLVEQELHAVASLGDVPFLSRNVHLSGNTYRHILWVGW